MTRCSPSLLRVLRAIEESRRPVNLSADVVATAVLLRLVKCGNTGKLRLTDKGEEVLRALHGAPA